MNITFQVKDFKLNLKCAEDLKLKIIYFSRFGMNLHFLFFTRAAFLSLTYSSDTKTRVRQICNANPDFSYANKRKISIPRNVSFHSLWYMHLIIKTILKISLLCRNIFFHNLEYKVNFKLTLEKKLMFYV